MSCASALFTALLVNVSAQNLILTNPNMESSSGSYFNGSYVLTGWNGNNSRYSSHSTGSEAPGGHAGSKSWKMTHGGSLTTNTANRPVVTGGKNYLFTFMMRKTADSPMIWEGIVSKISFLDATGTAIKVFNTPKIQANGTCDWRIVRLLGTAPLDAVAANLSVSFSSGGYPNEDGAPLRWMNFPSPSLPMPIALASATPQCL